MENKKIGICACYNTRNYGSMLQTLATILKINELGYDYEIIRYRRKPTLTLIIRSYSRIPEIIVNKVKKYKQKRKLRNYPDVQKKINERNECFDVFGKSNFEKISPIYYTFKQINNAARKYQAVLVGSDQLWRPEGYSTRFYNLLFVPDDIPKISYATSFGVSEIPNNKKKIAKKFLNRINAISVRELKATEIIYKLVGRKVSTVLDPTLLFSGKEWEKIIPITDVLNKNKKYIFCYLLGSNRKHREAVLTLSKAVGYTIVSIPHLDEFVEADLDFANEQLYKIGPNEFVNLIRNADYICTDSFHGTVFSILNHKNFVVFNRFEEGKNSRNSRIDSLCKQLELNERRCTDNKEIVNIMRKKIDYDLVEKKISDLRKSSLDFLQESLEMYVENEK